MGVYENIQKDLYKNYHEYPKRKDFKIMKVCQHCGSTYKDRTAESHYQDAQKLYQAANAKLFKQFKQDLFEEAGIVNHPKAEILWGISYEQRHSEGLMAIYDFFFNYLKLVI